MSELANRLRAVVRAARGRSVPPPKPRVETPYAEVELFSWAPADGRRNFGDHLSRIVCDAVAAHAGRTFSDEVATPRRLLAIGSILHFARDGDVVWGAGINGKIALDAVKARRLDVRAVRGPKTAEILASFGIDAPSVFGDPALLVPTLFPGRFAVKPVRDYVIVPNLHDLPLVEDKARLVSPLWGWNRCIEGIVGAEMVVASSLHGIILAEAFGVPARYVRLSETESLFKYDDYAQGTGRAMLEPAGSVAEALAMGGHPPPVFDAQALLAAFPFDLWR